MARKKAETKADVAAGKSARAAAGTARKKAAASPSSVAKRKAAPAKAAAKAAKPALKPAVKAGAKAGTKAGTRAAAKKTAARKAKTTSATPATTARRGATRGAPSERRVGARRRVATAVETDEAPHAVPGLSEEDQIRAAKYLPREMPKRLFEEERFIFPETYNVNRIRLLVRDPDWIFAYWDVSPAAMKEFARAIGERAFALSRLTLRVVDPVSGGASDILLPPGARWWYVRTDHARRTYRAELGVTLPSGEFRRLAESNTVVTPRVGPSAARPRRRMSYPDARELPVSAAEEAGEAERREGIAKGPWAPGNVEGAAAPSETSAARRAQKGGASDAFGPGGASDAFRPGASDGFRR
jgi:hypothetical protein